MSRSQRHISVVGPSAPDRGGIVMHISELVEPLARALQVAGLRPFAEPHLYRYTDPDRLESAAAAMRASGSGLLLIDSRRNGGWSDGFPRSDFVVSGSPRIDVELIVDDGFVQLYRWTTADAAGPRAAR